MQLAIVTGVVLLSCPTALCDAVLLHIAMCCWFTTMPLDALRVAAADKCHLDQTAEHTIVYDRCYTCAHSNHYQGKQHNTESDVNLYKQHLHGVL